MAVAVPDNARSRVGRACRGMPLMREILGNRIYVSNLTCYIVRLAAAHLMLAGYEDLAMAGLQVQCRL